jgi:hypothetical protein
MDRRVAAKVAKQLRDQKCNLFATYESIDKIMEIPNGAQTAVIVGITLNTVLELLAKGYEESAS